MASITRNISSKKNQNGKAEILLRLNVRKSVQLRLHSGLFIEPERFVNGEFVRPRVSSSLYHSIREIEKTLQSIEDYLLDLCQLEDFSNPTKDEVQLKLNAFLNPIKPVKEKKNTSKSERPRISNKEKSTSNFFETLRNFMVKRRVSDRRKERYAVVFRSLQRYEKYRKLRGLRPGELSFEMFTVDVIDDYEVFLRNESVIYDRFPSIYKEYDTNCLNEERAPRKKRVLKNTRRPKEKGNNYIILILKVVRSFFKYCVEQEIITCSPFSKYQGTTVERYGTPYYITLEERDLIADFDLSEYPALEIQRDIFIFQTLIGCRVSDLTSLTLDNVINGAIEYIPIKTINESANVIRVPLNKRGFALIMKYKHPEQESLFPFVSHQKYNEAIKRIFTICGITRLVTVLNPRTGKEEKRHINEIASSHMARRTFIGNLYKRVKDPNLVGALSGHTEGSKAFTRYREIDEDMKKELISYLD